MAGTSHKNMLSGVLLLWMLSTVRRVTGTACESVTCSASFSVTYTGSIISCDQFLRQTQTGSKPTLQFPGGNTGEEYLLLMLDPDAPTKEIDCVYWLHWMARVTKKANGELESDDEAVAYSGPSPPSGTHRYQFMLYANPPADLSDVPEGRADFNLANFLAANGLQSTATATFKFRVTAP